MPKKTLQLTATTFQEVEENLGAESIYLCQICKTFCDSDKFRENDENCIFCAKKIKQFKSLRIFTFKPCFYFFHKIGISKSDLEQIEYEQMICGMKTNYLDYNTTNLIWYINDDFDNQIICNKIFEMFDLFKKIDSFNKNAIKNSIDKFKHMFLNNSSYVSVHMVVNDFENDRLNFSSFLSRERLFI